MCDQDIVEDLYKKTGIGDLITPFQKPGRQAVYGWDVARQHEVEWLLKRVLPYLHSRKTSESEKCLEWLYSRITIKNCLICNNEFIAAQTRYVFCSSKCRNQGHNKGVHGMKYERKVV